MLRTGGFPGTIVGPGADHAVRHRCSTSCSRSDYPTWAVGVSVSYPIGESAEEANYARAQLEAAQSEQRLKSAEARAIQQVRDAAWKIEMNAKRIETTRAARELAEQRLDAERKRFEVGMSTSFLVIQAQRDLAQAKTNELAAVLAYDLSLVDFEALQQARPASRRRQRRARHAAAVQRRSAAAPRRGGAGAHRARDLPGAAQPMTEDRSSACGAFARTTRGSTRRSATAANRRASRSGSSTTARWSSAQRWTTREEALSHAKGQLRDLQRAGWNTHW